ncbi:MAG: rod shape-determining protein MreD [Bacteroidia bacterium]
MIINLIGYLIQFVLLVVVQVLIVNNVQLGGFINPFIYILFILTLPFDTPRWLLLLLAFLLGLSVDTFMDTMGMNAAATVFIAFCRPLLLKVMAPRDGYEPETTPSIKDMGFQWFITYSAILVFLHHLVLFLIESGRFNEIFYTLLKVILSFVLSITLIIIIQYLFAGSSRQRVAR